MIESERPQNAHPAARPPEMRAYERNVKRWLARNQSDAKDFVTCEPFPLPPIHSTNELEPEACHG